MKLAHIVNPVKVSATSDLYLAQPVTFESMRRAKVFASNTLKVELYTTQYPEDRESLPDTFVVLPDLTRSVLDVAQFENPRKLPLLADILQCLYDATSADYLIYTNVDIALMPHFYVSVAALLKKYSGLIINRRTINHYESVADLPLMYSDIGKKHSGYDCFVFRRERFPTMQLANICIGSPYIGLLMYANVMAISDKFTEIKEGHLTFHIGNDRRWLSNDNHPYVAHNERELQAGLLRLREQFGPFNNTTALGRFLIECYKTRKIRALESVLALDNNVKVLRLSLLSTQANYHTRHMIISLAKRLKEKR